MNHWYKNEGVNVCQRFIIVIFDQLLSQSFDISMFSHINALSVNLMSVFVCLFDLILYVPSTIFQLNRDGSSWFEPVLS